MRLSRGASRVPAEHALVGKTHAAELVCSVGDGHFRRCTRMVEEAREGLTVLAVHTMRVPDEGVTSVARPRTVPQRQRRGIGCTRRE